MTHHNISIRYIRGAAIRDWLPDLPLNEVWRHLGFSTDPRLQTDYVWKDVDEDLASLKLMQFYTKKSC